MQQILIVLIEMVIQCFKEKDEQRHSTRSKHTKESTDQPKGTSLKFQVIISPFLHFQILHSRLKQNLKYQLMIVKFILRSWIASWNYWSLFWPLANKRNPVEFLSIKNVWTCFVMVGEVIDALWLGKNPMIAKLEQQGNNVWNGNTFGKNKAKLFKNTCLNSTSKASCWVSLWKNLE